MAIRNIENLHKHLQWAIELEHATFPPYLCALYSIKQGHNQEATEILTSILMEEMLHMTLAANILNAVGGSPRFDKTGFIARYPNNLPHSDGAIQVSLSMFSVETIDTLMRIEKPQEENAPAEDDNYETISQFYASIKEGLVTLSGQLGEQRLFCGDPARQIQSDSFSYGGSGRVIAVTDLASALDALHEIVEQGEGMDHRSIWDGDQNMFHPERQEVGHYFRLKQILEERFFQAGDTPESGPTGKKFNVDWDAVYPMRSNPRAHDYPPGSEIDNAMQKFNLAYSEMLGTMQEMFNGKSEILMASVGEMMELKLLAIDLLKLSTGNAHCAGPSFDYIPPEHRQPPTGNRPEISIEKNGPYRVHGDINLYRKEVIYSEFNEPINWYKSETIRTPGSYDLCRCGHSSNKPFCDGSHTRVNFDGTEQADSNTIAERQHDIEYPDIDARKLNVKSDTSICVHAGFCFNRYGNINKMLESAEDVRVRNQVMAMVERCPSGALSYAIEVEDEVSGTYFRNIEPDLPAAINVIKNGPLWVTGFIPVERADHKPMEIRNRVTLCRCGQSQNKPYCDGTHNRINFKD